MKLLLDTHALLWFALNDPQLIRLIVVQRPCQFHEQRAGEADDGVERRSELVTYAGHELIFC